MLTRDQASANAPRASAGGSRYSALVVGASTGGVEALGRLLPALPSWVSVPVIVVVHQPANKPTLLPSIFVERSHLPVREAADKLDVEPGVIWFAPSGYHLYVERERTFALSVDASENFVRPAIDVLFDSAAQVYGAGLIAMVLTGANEDGAEGARTIREAGGMVLVQEPGSAVAPEMPRAAIARANPQHVRVLPELVKLAIELLQGRHS